MKIEDFRKLDPSSLELEDISNKFDKEVVEEIINTLNKTFYLYLTNPPEIGTYYGKGPIYQFCNNIMKEFIKKL